MSLKGAELNLGLFPHCSSCSSHHRVRRGRVPGAGAAGPGGSGCAEHPGGPQGGPEQDLQGALQHPRRLGAGRRGLLPQESDAQVQPR